MKKRFEIVSENPKKKFFPKKTKGGHRRGGNAPFFQQNPAWRVLTWKNLCEQAWKTKEKFTFTLRGFLALLWNAIWQVLPIPFHYQKNLVNQHVKLNFLMVFHVKTCWIHTSCFRVRFCSFFYCNSDQKSAFMKLYVCP